MFNVNGCKVNFEVFVVPNDFYLNVYASNWICFKCACEIIVYAAVEAGQVVIFYLCLASVEVEI